MVAGCGANFAKIVLVIVNIIFLLLGLGIAIAGLVFKFGEDLLKDDLKDVMENINVDMVGGIDIYSLVNQMSTIFIVVGFIIFALGFFGCCGACCQWRWMLVIYAIVVIILMIVQITGIALFASFKGKIDDSFSSEATKLLKDNYKPTPSAAQKKVKDGFNNLFSTFHCCGISNYSDVNNVIANLPTQCCDGTACTASNVNGGCFTKLDDLFKKYTTIFIAVGVAVIVFQLLCIIFSFCLCASIGREGAV